MQRLLETFDHLYQQKVGARYPVNWGKDGKLLKGLQGLYSDEDIERYMRAFFAIQDDFIDRCGYSVGTFKQVLPKVIQWAQQEQGQGHAAPSKANQGIAAWVRRQRTRERGH